ncbi:MAG: nucleotidyl transferase AbiEii/AbiGii toxin family protein [Propioniciclava sp.]
MSELPLERALRTAADQLQRGGVRFALIGGLAVSIQATPRFTQDADLAVAVSDDAEAKAVVRQAIESGFELVTLVEQITTGRLATARLLHPDRPGLITDLLFASSGIEPEIVAAATPTDVTATLNLPVASIAHLIVLKVLARDDRRRPTDADDLRALAAVADDADWRAARDAAQLVAERGFHRDRDLIDLITQLRTDGAY